MDSVFKMNWPPWASFKCLQFWAAFLKGRCPNKQHLLIPQATHREKRAAWSWWPSHGLSLPQVPLLYVCHPREVVAPYPWHVGQCLQLLDGTLCFSQVSEEHRLPVPPEPAHLLTEPQLELPRALASWSVQRSFVWRAPNLLPARGREGVRTVLLPGTRPRRLDTHFFFPPQDQLHVLVCDPNRPYNDSYFTYCIPFKLKVAEVGINKDGADKSKKAKRGIGSQQRF